MLLVLLHYSYNFAKLQCWEFSILGGFSNSKSYSKSTILPFSNPSFITRPITRISNIFSNQTIIDCETLGIQPIQEEIKISNYLKKRGRYTNKAFWESILVLQKDEHSKIEICNNTARDEGFKNLYIQISQ